MSTSTQKKNADLRKMFVGIAILFVACLVAMLLIGCASVPPKAAADPKASQAATPEEAVETPAAEESDGIYAFGETVTYANDISISVSEPALYTPTEYAGGVIEGQPVVVIELVLTNNSSEKYDPLIYNTASSAGVEASGVFDTSNEIGFPPTTAVLPGQTIKWKEAYSVADPASITLEIGAGFEYASSIFTNVAG